MAQPVKRDFVPRRPVPGLEREWEFGRFCLSVDFSFNERGCYIWTKNPARKYGAFALRGQVMAAHRAIYIICYGEIPDAAQVHHVCKNSRCVNPGHLQAETAAEHADEHPDIAHFIGRKPLTVCVSGRHPMDGPNLIVRANGKRQCRACDNEAQRAGSTFNRGDHKTECKHGHPWVPENIYVKPSTGHKECMECHRVAERKRQAKRRAAR